MTTVEVKLLILQDEMKLELKELEMCHLSKNETLALLPSDDIMATKYYDILAKLKYELFIAENDSFVVKLYRTSQKWGIRVVLSLVEQSFLNLLIRLYKGDLPYAYVHDFILKVCYRSTVFRNLSVYVFQNMFRLVPNYFGKSSFNELYCILFTCITLSDMNFTRGDSVFSTVYYFYSLYCIIACAGNKALRIVQENRDVQIAEEENY